MNSHEDSMRLSKKIYIQPLNYSKIEFWWAPWKPYKTTIILILTPCKHTTEKQIKININVYPKCSIKYLYTEHRHTQKIIHPDQVVFIPNMQGSFDKHLTLCTRLAWNLPGSSECPGIHGIHLLLDPQCRVQKSGPICLVFIGLLKT